MKGRKGERVGVEPSSARDCSTSSPTATAMSDDSSLPWTAIFDIYLPSAAFASAS